MKRENEKPDGHEGQTPPGNGQGHTVTVSIDGHDKEIRQGRYLVSDLKTALGVQTGYELDQIVDGHAQPLNDGDHVNVKKGDVFVSHVPRGSSS